MNAVLSCLCGSAGSDDEHEALLQNANGRLNIHDSDAIIDSEDYGSTDMLNNPLFGGISGIDHSRREKYLLEIVDATDDNFIDISTVEHPVSLSNINQRPLKEFRKMFGGRTKRKSTVNEMETIAGEEGSDNEEGETPKEHGSGRSRNRSKNKSRGSFSLSSGTGDVDINTNTNNIETPVVPTNTGKRGSISRREDHSDSSAPIVGSLESISSMFLGKNRLSRNNNNTANGTTPGISTSDLVMPTLEEHKKSESFSSFSNGAREGLLTLLGNGGWEVISSSSIPRKEREWVSEKVNSAFKAFKEEKKVYSQGDLMLMFR